MMEKRIAYYTRKVTEYGAVHISKRRNKNRVDRLLKYKKTMIERIDAQ